MIAFIDYGRTDVTIANIELLNCSTAGSIITIHCVPSVQTFDTSWSDNIELYKSVRVLDLFKQRAKITSAEQFIEFKKSRQPHLFATPVTPILVVDQEKPVVVCRSIPRKQPKKDMQNKRRMYVQRLQAI